MSLTLKDRSGFFAALALGFMLLFSGVVFSAESAPAPVPVTVSDQAGLTRIVFDFPKLFGYHVNKVGEDKIQIDVDTKAAVAIGAIKSAVVKGITEVANSEGILKLDITVPEGAAFKHYRLRRKIVIDVIAAGATPKETPPPKTAEKTPPPKAAEPAPLPPVQISKVEVKEPPKPIPEKPAPPPMKVEKPKEEAAKKAEPAPLPPAPPAVKPAPVVAADSDAEEKAPEEITRITLSFLASTHVAIFERAGALWIVTDAVNTRTSPPVISGTLAQFIQPPRTIKFEGGLAYRYTFPKKLYPMVRKQNLTWVISLLPSPLTPPPPVDMKLSFDVSSRKAKLIVPLKGAGETLALPDPVVGDILYVVPTTRPEQVVPNTRRLTDMEVMPAILGMVVRPLKDGLKVTPVSDFVLCTAPEGLTVTPEGVGTPVLIGEADPASDDDNNRLFDFPNWRMGGIRQLQENKEKIQNQIAAAQSPDDRTSGLMKLAMLYFANNFGHETLGLLALVLSENPDMDKNPDFIAIRGAASAMSGHFKEALQDLSYPLLQNRPEVNLWIGYAAAATEQWHMANKSFPKSNRLLLQYPDNIAIPFTIYMVESALHLGHTDTAQQLLGTINMTSSALDPQYQAAIDYLRGETYAQQGKLDRAEETWLPVSKGLDRLYHTKASLSLTRLLLKQKKISLKEAIDRLDNLRFAWRGNGLEVEVLRTLGALKVQDNQVLAGMQDIRQAADLSDFNLEDSTHIRDDMRRIFADLFVDGMAAKISPLEAVSVFNEFNSLLPRGEEGVTATLDFADYLVRMDLLAKAAEMIENQMILGMPENKMVGVSTKLAAVYLLDGRPQRALEALRKTERGGYPEKVVEERILLKARAQSQLNQNDAAISTLSGLTSRNARRLKADIFWRAQNWNQAASTIEALLPEPGTPVAEEDAVLVVNAVVAWKLARDMDKLNEIKSQYEAAMADTKLASTFGVVTRDGGSSSLADRDSMLKIAGEVDMFKGFLDSYKAGSGKGS